MIEEFFYIVSTFLSVSFCTFLVEYWIGYFGKKCVCIYSWYFAKGSKILTFLIFKANNGPITKNILPMMNKMTASLNKLFDSIF